ncbi:hypothetical protein [Acidovorax sp. Leaf78]|uniref:hypothetical protein n=1 Tax=unclassified Acidovorax TaxID=2684926 RepID=UPI0006F78014|nr:hypothetical protein [Acidovorax sp. Leaf78]KQO19701.1 hypothetical protein ASF16_07015 [Acidovorax sp. Leaf78]
MTQKTRRDITANEALPLIKEAATWKGTTYALRGSASTKGGSGDCSGTTFLIYREAGFPYEYQTSGTFPAYAQRSGLFRLLTATEAVQPGDVLSWPNHMAIYAGSALQKEDATTQRVNANGKNWTQHNDIFTATRPNGPAYMPASLRYWRPDPPKVYRYQTSAP